MGRKIKDEISGIEVRLNLHPKRKNNLQVAAMYQMYKGGKSLQQIAQLYGLTRQSVYDRFRTRAYPLRSKPMRERRIVDGIVWALGSHGGLRGTLPDGRRVLLHRYLWEKHNGAIPAGYHLRFKNGDKLDVRLENLEMLPVGEMQRRYSPHLNQFTSPHGSGVIRRARWPGDEPRIFKTP